MIRIKSHGLDTLCRQVYEEGVRHDWPGLGKEVTKICDEIGIADVNNSMVAKSEIKKAIINHHYEEMTIEVKKKTKLEYIKNEDLRKVQKYFEEKSAENTRMAFKIRTQMVPEIPANFKNKYRVKGTETEGLVCTECEEGEIMTQSHCLTCSAWADIREGLDLTDIKDLVTFFRKLLVERLKV